MRNGSGGPVFVSESSIAEIYVGIVRGIGLYYFFGQVGRTGGCCYVARNAGVADIGNFTYPVSGRTQHPVRILGKDSGVA